MKLYLKFSVAILMLANLWGCTKEQTNLPNYDEQATNISKPSTLRLSAYLNHLDTLAKSKTAVYSLEEGDISMISRAWLCEAAEKTIDVQYFIFSTDNVGLIAIDYLLRAADRGVQVRMIVDDIMVEADANELIALDAHPNISIKIYNPTANIGKNFPAKLYSLATDFRGFNQRMHNKSFIVDSRVVITGGRNIADEYFDYDHEYNFRDRDVLLIGKATHVVQNSFELFWNSSLSIPINKLTTSNESDISITKKADYLHKYASDTVNFWPQVKRKIETIPEAFTSIETNGALVWVDSISFITDNPGKNDGLQGVGGSGVTTEALVKLIQNAKHSITIQSPYLVTTQVGKKLFNDAVKRGVTINILTNSLCSTDNLEAFSGYQRDRDELLESGVHIFEFKPDAAIRYKIMTGALQKKMNFTPIFGLHAKSMVIDGEISVIGTFNLDPRSANLNTECITVIYNKELANKLTQSMTEDMNPENAWKTTTSFNPDGEASWVKRMGVWLRIVVPKSII